MLPNVGPLEMLLFMMVAVLLFGKRLPEVGRSLGKGIVEFKKGLRGIEEEFDLSSTSASTSSYHRSDDRGHGHAASSSGEHADTTSVPKFEPPTTAPTTAPVPTMEYQPGTPKD